MPIALEVAMVDVGGTLWPNSWPIRETDGVGRRNRLRAALPELDVRTVDELADDLIRSSRQGDLARSESTESEVAIPADVLIAQSMERQRLATDAAIVARIRRAMALPIADRMKPLPGAIELLSSIHDFGLLTVITSNTYWRDADSYWDDFNALGMADLIDAVITSVDVGHLKPHPAVFEAALRWAGVTPDHCVVIGNREENDIEPALAMGMWTILVHPDDPEPTSTRAHAVAGDLVTCKTALKAMLRD